MKLEGTNYNIRIKRNGQVWTNLWGKYQEITDDSQKLDVKTLSKLFRSGKYSSELREKCLCKTLEKWGKNKSEEERAKESSEIKPSSPDKEFLVKTIEATLNFFTEFNFEPNFRFINTMAYACQSSNFTNEVKSYINNYFELTDNVYAQQLKNKLESIEFADIAHNFSYSKPTHKVNTRFKLYYGSQGTGKTTKAMEESKGRCMVCHSAMLPSDLMEDFKFENGQPNFTPSALQIAMTEGQTIVLDEINLLPFESLRFLQSILDGKKEFFYKGKTIYIHDNFQIIGTMNLRVNGSTYALPEPLVDRASELRKFKLTAENLTGAIV